MMDFTGFLHGLFNSGAGTPWTNPQGAMASGAGTFGSQSSPWAGMFGAGASGEAGPFTRNLGQVAMLSSLGRPQPQQTPPPASLPSTPTAPPQGPFFSPPQRRLSQLPSMLGQSQYDTRYHDILSRMLSQQGYAGS